MLRISGKIPVSIYPFFWVLAILIGWLNSSTLQGTAIWTLIILVSVLVHEYGHALTAVAFGQSAQIDLVGFGGVTQRRGGGRLKLWQEFIIVLNGPMAGFCLALVAWWLYKALHAFHPDSLLTYIALIAFYINVFWTVVNLLPIQPLDGGKLLSIFLESILGLRGKKLALFISLFLSAGLGLFFFYIRAYLPGSLFFLFTFESYRGWRECMAMTEHDQNFILQHLFKEAERDLQREYKTDALEKYRRIRDLATGGVLYHTATERAAQLLAEKEAFEEAHDLLFSLGKKISPEGLRLLHQLAYKQGHWKEAISLGDRAHHYYPDYDVAIINAICHSVLGQVQPAVGWLQCAIQEGMPNVKEVLAKKEFDAIRNDPLFRKLKDQALS